MSVQSDLAIKILPGAPHILYAIDSAQFYRVPSGNISRQILLAFVEGYKLVMPFTFAELVAVFIKPKPLFCIDLFGGNAFETRIICHVCLVSATDQTGRQNQQQKDGGAHNIWINEMVLANGTGDFEKQDSIFALVLQAWSEGLNLDHLGRRGGLPRANPQGATD